VKIYDGHVQVFAFCLLSAPADLTCVAPHFEHMKRNIQLAGERSSVRSPHVSFLETRNAQGAVLALFLFLCLFSMFPFSCVLTSTRSTDATLLYLCTLNLTPTRPHKETSGVFLSKYRANLLCSSELLLIKLLVP
jgi:hypothetical protein